MTPANQVLVLEQQGRAEPAGFHQGVVVDVVLVQRPLRARRQAEVVGAQPHDDARRACGVSHTQLRAATSAFPAAFLCDPQAERRHRLRGLLRPPGKCLQTHTQTPALLGPRDGQPNRPHLQGKEFYKKGLG